MKKIITFITCICLSFLCNAQTYTLLIKGGRLIDTKNNIDAVMDVAITDGKITQVAKSIDPKLARQVVDAKGMLVTPGLIDIHGHVFHGTEVNHYLSNGLYALAPDGYTFRVGVTTIVDAGGAGWKSFDMFKQNVILTAKTRVLSFMNIVGEGMRGGKYEQDTTDMDSRKAAEVALANKNDVVGFKVAHYQGSSWAPVDHAVAAGKLADMPVMVDFGGSQPPLPLADLFLKHLRPGDIFTHTYTLLPNNVRETIVDEATQTVKPFALEARKRGLVFDVGYGGASFNFSQAIPALKNKFYPTTISTDLHTGSMNGSMKDILSIMSKFVAMGEDVPSVIKATTWSPAQVIKRENLGHLSVGAIADVAILSMRQGDFGFYDKTGFKLKGKQKFECEMTIKGGKIVYDLNGIVSPMGLN
ncbi:amidohydrolase/deacetylase family metallohydrolase [Spirosoma daeguense]